MAFGISLNTLIVFLSLLFLLTHDQVFVFALALPRNSMETRIHKLGRHQPDEESRDAKYSHPNSTIPTAREAATNLGVKPPLDAPARAYKRAWKIHRAAMPFLHFGDRCKPPDSSLSLMCLWWKALAANDPRSPVHDNSLTYDMLPSVTRLLVGPAAWRWYPRLHHANVEIRTTFLDRSIKRLVEDLVAQQLLLQQESSSYNVTGHQNRTKVRLITLGGGYDARSIKLRQAGLIDQAIELDLANVVDAKRKIFASPRLHRRRRRRQRHESSPESQLGLLLPDLYPVDLNRLPDVEAILTDLVASSDVKETWHTIFLFEGVMIYLDESVPNGLLNVCRNVLRKNHARGSLVFADRLERIPGGDYDIARTVLAEAGWRILDWQPKPGLARHMGVAEPIEAHQGNE